MPNSDDLFDVQFAKEANPYTLCPICACACYRIGEDSYTNDVWECCKCELRYSSGIGLPTKEQIYAQRSQTYTANELIKSGWWRDYYEIMTLSREASYDDIEISATGKRVILRRTADNVTRYISRHSLFLLAPKRPYALYTMKSMWKPGIK